jgi:thiamine biosynthesis lipoprotein
MTIKDKTRDIMSCIPSEKDSPVRFTHKAMNTIYEILIHHDNTEYAWQAANAAFNEIDRLELELSRFNANSDISRVNAMKQFETVTLGNDCYQCLQQCSRLYQQTKGVFDISAGFIVELWKELPDDHNKPDAEKIKSVLQFSGMPWLHLLGNFQVQLMSEKISLDLGGFGKGYAIKIAGDLLRDWDISNGIINAGMSTIMPVSVSTWPVEIKHPYKNDQTLLKTELSARAISASGLKKGQHIIDPRNGYPVYEKIAVWVIAEDPGISDALSTAFMIMTIDEIENFCETRNIQVVILTAQDKIVKIGF